MEPPVRLLLAIAVLVAAPSALAQAANQPAKVCAEPGAAPTGEAPAASDASKDAAPVISAGADACAAGQGVTPASSGAIAATLAEAERRVANLKFEVGPPPRNLTRGANSVSRPIS
jgi:hypothetical protein